MGLVIAMRDAYGISHARRWKCAWRAVNWA